MTYLSPDRREAFRDRPSELALDILIGKANNTLPLFIYFQTT